MEISEVRIKLMSNPNDRLKAFASVTFDEEFVIRDIKIIDGGSGVFVAMPSRKLADHCPECDSKNYLRAKFCGECGAELPRNRVPRDRQGRNKLHADIAHPINSTCRQRLQECIVEAFQEELERSKEDGYRPPPDFEEEYDDDDEGASGYDDLIGELRRDAAHRDSGRGGSPRESRRQESPRRQEAPQRQESQRRSDRPARDRDRGSRPPRSRPPEVPVAAPAAAPQSASNDDSGDDEFGVDLLDTPAPSKPKRAPVATRSEEKPVEREPSRPREREQVGTAAAAQADTDGTDDFGAGLL